MTDTAQDSPLLFLDVDGTLLPYGGAQLPSTPEEWDRRPFVWMDDEPTDLDRAWVATHHRGAALLHQVNSTTGLTPADLATVDSWLLLHRPAP